MCDTIAVVRNGSVLFAKNSDRDPNEAQLLDWQPRHEHPSGSTLKCTYLEIDQVRQTAAVLLSRPFWMWGAEIGTNEHGVVIGNEAVFTREKKQAVGLTGMDLVRLALERSTSADEAVGVITTLLERHGQGGGCGFEDRNFSYHNSFLVADASGARVVETAGRHHATEVVDGARSISNGLTIPGFAETYSDRLRTAVSASRTRQPRTQALAVGAASAPDMAKALRDHGGETWPAYRRLNGTLAMACMHGGSEIASSVSTASWISHLTPAGPLHWATATSSPCLSLFKPVKVGQPLVLDPTPRGTADDSLWWAHERLHRAVMRNPEQLASKITAERDELEHSCFNEPPDSADAFVTHRRLIDQWSASLGSAKDVRPRFARRYWAKRDRQAGIATTRRSRRE